MNPGQASEMLLLTHFLQQVGARAVCLSSKDPLCPQAAGSLLSYKGWVMVTSVRKSPEKQFSFFFFFIPQRLFPFWKFTAFC